MYSYEDRIQAIKLYINLATFNLFAAPVTPYLVHHADGSCGFELH